MVCVFLNGGGMVGGPLHDRLLGAPMVREVRTAPRYRFYSVGDRYPAMLPVSTHGAAVSGELYDLPMSTLHDSLLPGEPKELELSVIELSHGELALGFVLRRTFDGSDELTDISETGSWRDHLRTLGRDT